MGWRGGQKEREIAHIVIGLNKCTILNLRKGWNFFSKGIFMPFLIKRNFYGISD